METLLLVINLFASIVILGYPYKKVKNEIAYLIGLSAVVSIAIFSMNVFPSIIRYSSLNNVLGKFTNELLSFFQNWATSGIILSIVWLMKKVKNSYES